MGNPRKTINPNRRPGSAHKPDAASRKHVQGMSAIGFNQHVIATVMDIDPTTLRKHYRDELDNAAHRANAQVGITFFQMATGGGDWKKANMRAVETWARFRMGWKEPPQGLEFSGPDGGAIETKDVSAREFIESELARLTARARAKGDPEPTE